MAGFLPWKVDGRMLPLQPLETRVDVARL